MSDDRIQHAISAIELCEDVPEDVVQRFEDVKSVLEGAQEDKRLVRVAVEYSVASFELSLRLLCDRLGFEDAMDREADQTLWNFIEWLHKQDYLPRYAAEMPEDLPPYSRAGSKSDEPGIPDFYRSLRDLRNRWLHPFSDSWLGWSTTRFIPKTVELINDFYDDPELRQEERAERRCVSGHCRRLSRDGAALDLSGRRILIHELNMLHFDKTKDPSVYYFAFWPLFDLDPEIGQELSDREPYLAKCSSWDLEDGSLSISTMQGTSILVDRNLKSDERSKLENWLDEAGRSRRAAFDLCGPAELRSQLLDLDSHWSMSLQDFHWIE
jgi:hypothetical protein